jgi:hypothetical protein
VFVSQNSPTPQQVDLWVRVGKKPFPHIHTYILQDQAGTWCTQLQILDLPVLELNSLNFHLFFKKKIPPAKRVLSIRSSKSLEIYPIKTCLFFFIKGYARPEIRRPCGHAAVPTHTCTTRTHRSSCCGPIWRRVRLYGLVRGILVRACTQLYDSLVPRY